MWKNKKQALDGLCEKYSVAKGEFVEKDGKCFVRNTSDGKMTELLPWRVERRFIELQKIITDGTLEGLSTFRFARISHEDNLTDQLKKELDLALWLSKRNMISLFAVCGGEGTANVIVKLDGGLNVSIECSTQLPAGQEVIDRHEIIASRGVASDRAVDTQIPQASVYLYNNRGEQRYTDTDEELFGLSDNEILQVRAAFAVLSHPELSEEWNQASAFADRAAEMVRISDRDKKVIMF